MAVARSEWLSRHRTQIMTGVIGLLVLVVAVEGFFLYLQLRVGRQIENQSANLLARFLEDEQVEPSGAPGVLLRLQNVRFKWSDKVYIDTGSMAVRAVPIQGSVVNFDNLDSFLLNVQRSEVLIEPEVLEGMFNESVFNYPDSDVRDLSVSIKEHVGEYAVSVSGSLKLVLWMPFKMRTQLSIDTATNTLVIDTDKVEILGFLPATALIKWKPLRLENIIEVPSNKSLIIDENRIMVKPFGLFPPPRINGRMSGVSVDAKMVRLRFSGDAIQTPEAPAKNYIYLKDGASQFGRFRMLQTDILVIDQDETDPFIFSLQRYADLLPKSTIELRDTRSARVTMPDL